MCINRLNLQHYVVEDPTEFNLYAHGGMGFWMISSGVFVIVSLFLHDFNSYAVKDASSAVLAKLIQMLFEKTACIPISEPSVQAFACLAIRRVEYFSEENDEIFETNLDTVLEPCSFDNTKKDSSSDNKQVFVNLYRLSLINFSLFATDQKFFAVFFSCFSAI